MPMGAVVTFALTGRSIEADGFEPRARVAPELELVPDKDLSPVDGDVLARGRRVCPCRKALAN